MFEFECVKNDYGTQTIIGEKYQGVIVPTPGHVRQRINSEHCLYFCSTVSHHGGATWHYSSMDCFIPVKPEYPKCMVQQVTEKIQEGI